MVIEETVTHALIDGNEVQLIFKLAQNNLYQYSKVSKLT